MLRYALDYEMIRLEAVISSSAESVDGRNAALSSLLFCGQIYSELHHADAGNYGVHAAGEDVATFQTLLGMAQSGQVSDLWNRNRGTLDQRIAFLADTDYTAFRAREIAAITAQGGAGEAEARAQIPSAEIYYRTRAALLQTVEIARAQNGNVHEAIANTVAQLSVIWRQRSVRVEVRIPPILAPNGGGIISTGRSEWRWQGQNIANELSASTTYIFQRYVRSANPNSPWWDLYSKDRYFQAQMALPYLQGWRSASDADRAAVADAIDPVDRNILLHSLAMATLAFSGRGNEIMAGAAHHMATFIQERFNAQMTAMYNSELQYVAFDMASSSERALHGLEWLGPVYEEAYWTLPLPVRRLADTRSDDARRQYLIDHPFVVRYTPVYLAGWIDRSILDGADILSPVYHTWLRATGWATGVTTSPFLNTANIRAVMEGDFSQRWASDQVSFDAGHVLLDAGMTALTIFGGYGAARGMGGAGASVLRRVGVSVAAVLTPTVTSSVLMSAVEVSPLPPEYKAPLRFAVGLAAGFGTGAAQQVLSRLGAPTLLEGLTFTLARVSRLAANATGQTLVTLNRQITTIQNALTQLRAFAGEAAREALIAFENQLTNALDYWHDLQAILSSPGLRPSAQFAMANGPNIRTAAMTVRNTMRNVGAGYDDLERAVLIEFDVVVGPTGIIDDASRAKVWTLEGTVRGQLIERHLAQTEYADWFNIGAEHHGYFRLIDFQQGRTVASLKTVDTRGVSWLRDMQDHLRDLGSRGIRVDDLPVTTRILDLRVQPGGEVAAQQLVAYGQSLGVTVVIRAFP